MANRDNPFGFIPVGRLGGGEIPKPMRFAVASDNATGLFVGDLVSALASGKIGPAAADPGDIMLGAVVGLYDSNGVAIGSPQSSVATKYLPASTAGYADIVPALPDVIFRCQCLTGATPAATDVFNASDHTAGAGDTTTGKSNHELTATFSTANMFKVIGKVEGPNNDWGEHVEVLVVAEESYWHDGTAGV